MSSRQHDVSELLPPAAFRFTNPYSAAEAQETLARLVREYLPKRFRSRFVCGLDAAYFNGRGVGVAAVWNIAESRLAEIRTARRRVPVRYVPGFFSYREGPLVLAAVRRLTIAPDGYLVDGHGRAHPRRFGLACHVGLALKAPTVGVAKSILCGREVGDYLVGDDGSKMARVMKVVGQRAFYVSVGHMIDLESAFSLVRTCIFQGHVEPLRVAHIVSNEIARARHR